MRALGQLGESGDAHLGAAAVGAEQVPFHGEQPCAHAGEAGLDRRPLGDAELARQQLGLEPHHVGRHAGQHEVGELVAESVAVGRAIDLVGERIRPLARALRQLRRRDIEIGLALALGEGHRLQHALLDDGARLRRELLAEQPADEGQRLPLERVGDLAAGLLRARYRTPARSGGTGPW